MVYGELAGSAHLAEAAAHSAKRGVEANLSLLNDEQYKEKTKAMIEKSCRNCVDMRKRMIGSIANT